MNKFMLFLVAFVLVFLAEGQTSKKFELYDALAYPGKPDLEGEGLLPLFLIYEAALTKPDPDNPSRAIPDYMKIDLMAHKAEQFPKVMVSTDIEDWFSDSSLDAAAMSDRFRWLFAEFRGKNPDVVIGNYGLAPSALCVYRFYDNGQTDEELLLQQWRNNNQKRWPSLSQADVCTPSVYIAQPDVDSWIRDLQITVAEIRKYEPEKKIIVYIWPQYYNKPDSPYYKQFLSGEKWTQMLEAVYEHCDGAILWSTTTDDRDELVRWSDPRVQAVWTATRAFIDSHRDHMVIPEVSSVPIETDDPDKSFVIYASVNYAGTPNLSADGLHPYRVINESEISTGPDANDIYQPDSAKLAQLALSMAGTPDLPLLILNNSWIRDRSSDQKGMVDRFETAWRIFKQHNDTNPLWFFQVGPSSLGGLRISNSNFFITLGNWTISAVAPTRPLRNIVDVIVPSLYVVDDDTTLWKKEFMVTMNEVKGDNTEKPVYALLYTDYFNQQGNFAKAYRPVSEATWSVVLETVFRRCDGIILKNIGNAPWDEADGFWRATKRFIDAHKSNIIFPTGQTPVQGSNILKNGSFEDPIDPSAIETTFGVDYVAPLRSTGFFDAASQTTNPSSAALEIPDYVWFERGTSQHQCRINVENTTSHSGMKSMTIFNVGGSTSDATSKLYAYHNLAQRVSLDDSKNYLFSFYVQRDFEHRNAPNLIEELYVGIISSTGAVSASNSTYYQKIALPPHVGWEHRSVEFNLPEIIDQHPGKSFEKCAVFIAMQTGWDSQAGKTLQSKVNVDDLSLIEIPGTYVAGNLPTPMNRISVSGRNIEVAGGYCRFAVYDLYGRTLHFEQSQTKRSGGRFIIEIPGIYVVAVDDQRTKICVN